MPAKKLCKHICANKLCQQCVQPVCANNVCVQTIHMCQQCVSILCANNGYKREWAYVDRGGEKKERRRKPVTRRSASTQPNPTLTLNLTLTLSEPHPQPDVPKHGTSPVAFGLMLPSLSLNSAMFARPLGQPSDFLCQTTLLQSPAFGFPRGLVYAPLSSRNLM